MYLTGKHRNILALQSHPEFELKYAIYDRIWLSVVEKNKRLTEEQVVEAKRSFEDFSDDDRMKMSLLISSFLRS